MIQYLPQPLPDEIFHGLIGRYCDLLNTKSVAHMQLELFGSRTANSSLEFPSRLDYFVSHAKHIFNYTSEEIITKYSMFPYWVNVFTDDKAKLLVNKMRSSDTYNINAVAGLNSSKLKTTRIPRYCPECVNDDIKKFGQPYFHRIHQLPTPICGLHDTFLTRIHLLSSQHNPQRYFSILDYSFDERLVKKNSNGLIRHLTNQSIKLLFGEIHFKVESLNYQKELNLRGYGRGKNLDHAKIAKSIFDFYGERDIKDLLDFCNIESLQQFYSTLIYSTTKVINPLRHLFLLDFLEHAKKNSPPIFLSINDSEKWPCFNKASSHYLLQVIESCERKYDIKTKQTVSIFRCSCGMVYKDYFTFSKRLNSNLRKIKIISYGEDWLLKLKSLLIQGHSLYSIAKELGVNIKTARRLSKTLVIEDKNLANEDYMIHVESLRKIWLKALAEKSYSITDARNSHPNVYKWLYRNDREWLKMQNAKCLRPRESSGQLIIDWEKRDKEILSQIQINFKELINSNYPKQITKTLLFKSISDHKNISTKRQELLLPKTLEFINTVKESRFLYQRRKIETAKILLESKNQRLTRGNLLRVSKIRTVDTSIEQLIAKMIN